MKITCIIPSFYPAVVYGGWIFSSLNAYRELGKLGAITFVSTTNDNGKASLQPNPDKYVLLENNIFVKYYPQSVREKFSLSMIFKMWKDIRKGDLVKIHGIFSATTPIGLAYSFIFGKKTIVTPHGCLGEWCLSNGSKLKSLYLKFLIRPFADRVIWHATCMQEADEIKALFKNANVEIIPNGVSVEEFDFINHYSKTDFLKKLTGKTMDPHQIFISMGRLHKKKGFDILIEAFSLYSADFQNAVLLIAGDDFGDQGRLEKLVKELGLEEKVFFIGHLDGQEKVDFFGNGDIFVLPSHNENFGMVYAEAMAAGTPVIASKGTPWKEVDELGIGKWVENNSTDIKKAMVDLATSDYKELGRLSKKFIKEKYSWQSVANQIDQLLKKTLNRTN